MVNYRKVDDTIRCTRVGPGSTEYFFFILRRLPRYDTCKRSMNLLFILPYVDDVQAVEHCNEKRNRRDYQCLDETAN